MNRPGRGAAGGSLGAITPHRHLDWDGCFNARDLGGLPTDGGRETRRGALVRADALDHLTAAGWAAVLAHGIRTVIDLRNDDERTPDRTSRPAALTTLHVPLDGIEDREFWDDWSGDWRFGTPLYYAAHLERLPERSAAVIGAIARARPGGVVFHCGIGRDRTGLVAIVALTLAGVAPADIVADYALSAGRLAPLFARRGEPDQGPLIEAAFARAGTSAAETIVAALDAIDVEAALRRGGLGDSDLAAFRARLLLDPAA